jgi:hypothetical protein
MPNRAVSDAKIGIPGMPKFGILMWHPKVISTV